MSDSMERFDAETLIGLGCNAGNGINPKARLASTQRFTDYATGVFRELERVARDLEAARRVDPKDEGLIEQLTRGRDEARRELSDIAESLRDIFEDYGWGSGTHRAELVPVVRAQLRGFRDQRDDARQEHADAQEMLGKANAKIERLKAKDEERKVYKARIIELEARIDALQADRDIERRTMAWALFSQWFPNSLDVIDAARDAFGAVDAFLAAESVRNDVEHAIAQSVTADELRGVRRISADERLGVLSLDSATMTLLSDEGVETVGALAKSSPHELLKISGIGAARLRQIRRALDVEGLSLDMSPRALLVWKSGHA